MFTFNCLRSYLQQSIAQQARILPPEQLQSLCDSPWLSIESCTHNQQQLCLWSKAQWTVEAHNLTVMKWTTALKTFLFASNIWLCFFIAACNVSLALVRTVPLNCALELCLRNCRDIIIIIIIFFIISHTDARHISARRKEYRIGTLWYKKNTSKRHTMWWLIYHNFVHVNSITPNWSVENKQRRTMAQRRHCVSSQSWCHCTMVNCHYVSSISWVG